MSRVFQRTERNDDRWWIEWRDERGKKCRKCVGPSRRQAIDVLKVIEAKVVKRRNQPQAEACRLVDLVAMYKDTVLPTLQWGRHVSAILREMTEAWGDRLLVEIGPRDIEAYRAARLGKLQPATINRHVAVIRRIFNLAMDWGLADVNPAARVKSLKERNARERFLDLEQACRLVEAAPAYLRPAILLALNTGARRAELLTLRWEHVNFTTNTISFLKTKSGKRRDIQMSAAVVEILKGIKREGDFVLMHEGRPLGEFRAAFKRACDEAGIPPGFRWHDLRHVHASHHAMSGHDLATLQRRLGHASIQMTMRYSHLSGEHEREAANAVVLGIRPTVREGVVAFNKPLSRWHRR